MTTLDPKEIENFNRLADEWWDEKGKFAPLHLMNPVRIGYVREQCLKHFNRDDTLTPFQGLEFVDIGCGGGLLSEPMARMGARVTGIDAAPRNIEVAKIHGQQSDLTIDYQHITAENLVKTGKTYDVVLALEIIEHVADVDLFLKSLRQLVKPGGLVICSTLNRTLRAYALAILGAEYILRWLPKGTHDWHKFITPYELRSWALKQKLDCFDVKGMIFNPLTRQWQLGRDTAVNYITAMTTLPLDNGEH